MNLKSIAEEKADCLAAWKDKPVGTIAILCNHDMALVPLTQPAENRIEYIFLHKLKKEQARRLRHFRPLPEEFMPLWEKYAMYRAEYITLFEEWRAELFSVGEKWRLIRDAVDAKFWPKLEALAKKWKPEIASLFGKWWTKREALLAKWRPKLAAVDAKCRPEYDALHAKWQAKLDALYAKWRPELAAVDAMILQLNPGSPWDGKRLC